MRRLLVCALLVVVLGVAGCGSTNTAQTVPTPTASATIPAAQAIPATATTLAAPAPTTPTSTAQSVTSPTASTPVTVTTETITAPDSGGAGFTSTVAAASECVAADLSLSAVPPNSGPGITVLGFTLSNVSHSACESGAYPGIGLISASGAVDDVTTTRTTSDDLGATPVTQIDLAPGAKMSFRITLHDAGAGSGAGCGNYTGVQVIAPNDTATMTVSVPDGPVQACGDVGVSPLEPGTDGTGQ